jgi:hypothetical protein
MAWRYILTTYVEEELVIPLFSTEPSFTHEISDYEHFGSNLYQ